MAFPITENARNAANQTNVKPIIVMEIEGVPYRLGSSLIVTFIRIGDDGLYINNYQGQPWVIGGFRKLENQFDYISFDRGGAAKITQSLRADQGTGTSVSRLQIAVIDKNEEISELISPGFVVDEILGKNVRIYQGFENTAFPEDFITIFRGSIEGIDSGPGLISFNLSSVEEKKRQGIYRKRLTQLSTAISAVGSISTIDLDDASDFLLPITGPDGSEDNSISFYVKINDEVFKYNGISGNQLTGVSRAQLGSIQEEHDVDDKVTSVFRFEENGVTLALKMMLSGQNGFYAENIPIKSFQFISGTEFVDNAAFINDINIVETSGMAVGDYVTITGASNGANNVIAVQILDIVISDIGTYVVLNSNLATELGSSAVMAIRSQYDTLPEGLGMKPFEVDIDEHVRLFRLFLSSFNYDFRIEDISDVKKFLDEQVYLPMSGFSIPRKGRASMGYTIGPIPGSNIRILDRTNIQNADQLRLSRSLSRNFSNTVRYNSEYNIVTGDFDSVYTYEDAQSKADIPVGDKTTEIDALGMRVTTLAQTLSQAAANRRLKRYARGAESIKGVKVLYGDGFDLEISDIILFDTNALNVTDTSTGSRSGNLKFMEVTNKILDNKDGEVVLDLLATAIAVGERYGLISPASKIKSAESAQVFTLEKSFFTNLLNEGRKWQDLIGASIKVRSVDYATVSTDAVITNVAGDKITLDVPLSFTPSAGQIMELSNYDLQPDLIKALYAFYSDGTNDFADGAEPYVFL